MLQTAEGGEQAGVQIYPNILFVQDAIVKVRFYSPSDLVGHRVFSTPNTRWIGYGAHVSTASRIVSVRGISAESSVRDELTQIRNTSGR